MVGSPVRQLESLLGKLKFAASCVRPGRVFTVRLLSDLRNAHKTGQFQITSEAKADLSWWRRFLAIYKGISMMPEEEWSGPGAIFTTDACLEGCGGGFKAGFSCPIPQDSPTKSAAHKCPWAANHLGCPASVVPRADGEKNCSEMWYQRLSGSFEPGGHQGQVPGRLPERDNISCRHTWILHQGKTSAWGGKFSGGFVIQMGAGWGG